jgi:NTE family protein
MRLSDRLASQPFGLVLSAGFFGFFGHAGVLASLEAHGLSPAAYAGTSAGALVAAMAASGLGAAEVAERLCSVRKEDFWDPSVGGLLGDVVRGGLTGLLRGDRFRAKLDSTLPAARFEDCAHPLVVVTSDVTRAASRVHDRGPLAPVIHASCAYPGLFRAVDDGASQLWDGGLIDKAPIVALLDRQPALRAILVVYLPSQTRARASRAPRRHGYVGGLQQGLAAVRHEHYVLQARLAEARGIPVFELSPDLPPVGPSRLSQGPIAIAEARRLCDVALTDDEQRCRSFAR